jgi:hypothetical protein
LKTSPSSHILSLATKRPSIFYHLSKLGLLTELALKMGWVLDEDEMKFVASFQPIKGSEIFSGVYKGTEYTVDANTLHVTARSLTLSKKSKKSA